MTMYKLPPKNPQTGMTPQGVTKLDTFLWIPFDPANTDYQEYCRWLADGNLPEPADEGEQQ